jgi:hypothetical protein
MSGDAALAAGTTSARVAGKFISATRAGEMAGEAGLTTSSTFQKLLRFSNPAVYSSKAYEHMAASLGFNGDAAGRFVEAAMNKDSLARRVYVSKGGVPVYRDLSKNPFIRMRNAKMQALGNSVASKSEHLAKVVGDEAMYKRWRHIDIGSRKAAVTVMIQRQLGAFHNAGKLMSELTHGERTAFIEPTARTGLIAQSHVIARAGAPGSAEEAAQIAQLAKEKIMLVASDAHRDPLMEQAYARIEKAAADGKGDAALEDFWKEHWAHANVTNDPAKALLDANGYWRGVTATGAGTAGKEVLNATGVVKLMFNGPTTAWKYLLLGASPRYFVNNFVGNSLMLMAATDPVSLSKAFFTHFRTIHAGKLAERASEDAIRGAALKVGTPEALAKAEDLITKGRAIRKIQGRHWMEKWFGGEYGFGNSNRVDPKTGLPERHGIQRLPALHKFTHEHADMPQRYMAMNYTMKRIPEYQRAYARYRAAGMDHWRAEMKASEMAAENPAVRQLIRQQVNHMFGQYHSFHSWENSARMVMPFYAWTRAISTHMKYLITQQTYKAAMGAAIGTLGNVKTQEIMGQVPDFMLGAIPAKLLTGPLSPLADIMGQNGNRVSVFTTAGLNPYASVGDISAMGAAALGIGHFKAGESLGSSLNPVLQGAAQQLAGVSLQSGTPLPPSPGGPIVGTYLAAFGNVPEWNLLQGLLGMESSTTKKGNPTLYAHNLQSVFSSYAGVPIRQADLGVAAKLANLDSGVKHPQPRKHKPSF